MWSKDGRELFYRERRTPNLVAVAVETGDTFVAGARTTLFRQPEVSAVPPGVDVAKDGRFLMIKEDGSTAGVPQASRLIVVEHWLEELKQKATVP